MKELNKRNYLDEDYESFETRGILVHETGILGEPLDVAFVPGVHENGSIFLSAAPGGVIDQISLLKRLVALRVIVEVVKCLSEVFCSVELVFGGKRELFWPEDRRRELRCGFGKGDSSRREE